MSVRDKSSSVFLYTRVILYFIVFRRINCLIFENNFCELTFNSVLRILRGVLIGHHIVFMNYSKQRESERERKID